ncbi:FMN reductase [Azohydromonas lata]|uniref:FMN reductase n=1 Tax=Azohydromonas lata TaxID=45677 RepID=A0ABU5IG12_9BURK|nr:FMN reductase [Azohydromonas lata]MDZ5458054.1 FMN reductase [Azohydromonas lata]
MNTRQVTLVIGNVSERSRTKALAQAIADALAQRLPIQLRVLEIHQLAPSIGVGTLTQELPPAGRAAVQAIENADLVIAVTPVYKGSYSGLFKHLFDLVHPEALVDRPVLLAANGGSPRHALVVDHQLRPLFAFFRALTVPSAVYACESDFDGYAVGSDALQQRIAEAVDQAARLLLSRREAAVPLREAA